MTTHRYLERVVYSTRNLRRDLRDMMNEIAREHHVPAEQVLNQALERGLRLIQKRGLIPHSKGVPNLMPSTRSTVHVIVTDHKGRPQEKTYKGVETKLTPGDHRLLILRDGEPLASFDTDHIRHWYRDI